MIRPNLCGIMCCSARLGCPERRHDVPAQHRLERLGVGIDDVCVVEGAAGIVDENVDTAEALDGAVNDRLDIALLHHVAPEEGGPVAGADLLQRLLTLVLVPPVDRHLGAFTQVRLGDSAADASRPSGNERYLSRQDCIIAGPLLDRGCDTMYVARSAAVDVTDSSLEIIHSDSHNSREAYGLIDDPARTA